MADRIEIMYQEEEVRDRIEELGREITADYAGKELTLVCILKGAAFFACELAKRIDLPLTIEFMRCSSYGDETVSSGVVKIVQDLDSPIRGRHIIVVEDIIDTGRTMHYLLKILRSREPASLKLCSLLDKPDRRVAEVELDYTGFVIPDKFIVGYGLDYAQKYRNLPYIGVVTPGRAEDEESQEVPVSVEFPETVEKRDRELSGPEGEAGGESPAGSGSKEGKAGESSAGSGSKGEKAGEDSAGSGSRGEKAGENSAGSGLKEGKAGENSAGGELKEGKAGERSAGTGREEEKAGGSRRKQGRKKQGKEKESAG